jgi:DNA-binding NtrC family response regulator
MAELNLQGCRVLIVEDEPMLAHDLRQSLEEHGILVLGPAYSVESALALVRSERELHGAVLDINVGGEMVFPVAEALAVRGVPFIFATGYGPQVVPERYAFAPHCEKPVGMAAVARTIGKAMIASFDPAEQRRRTLTG